MSEEFAKYLKKNRRKIPQHMRDTVHCHSVLQNIFAAGQLSEREACAELVESVEDHCYSASAACAYFNQSECVDKSTIFCAIRAIRKRGEVGK
jgi:hypothetical protein